MEFSEICVQYLRRYLLKFLLHILHCFCELVEGSVCDEHILLVHARNGSELRPFYRSCNSSPRKFVCGSFFCISTRKKQICSTCLRHSRIASASGSCYFGGSSLSYSMPCSASLVRMLSLPNRQASRMSWSASSLDDHPGLSILLFASLRR